MREPKEKTREIGLFAKELKLRRELARLSMGELGRKVGMAKGYICGIETAKTAPPSRKVVKRLAAFFKMNEKHYLMMAWADKAPKEVRADLRTMVVSYMSGFM